MTLQTVKLSELEPPSANPRRGIDASGIESLAQSIRTDGVLHNLVVVPVRGGSFRIVSGERRYRALQLLLERGEIAADYDVPVEVRKLAAGDAHRIATVENVQREPLAPLDEAAAFAGLLRKNVSIEDISAQTGMAVRTIRQRLCLLDLHEDVQTALREGRITLAQARALTCGSHDQQLAILEDVEQCGYTSDEIRERLLEDKPAVSEALFDAGAYTGTFTSDLFADDATTYFDDVEQFAALQTAAVQVLAEEKRAGGAAFVEVTEGYLHHWAYRAPESGEQGGVVINLAPSGRVDILENVVPASETASAASAEERSSAPKPYYSAPLMRLMAHHKSLAVQRSLIEHPRLAKEIACVNLLAGGLLTSRHEALQAFAVQNLASADYSAVENRAADLCGVLKAAGVDLPECDPAEAAWLRLADHRGRRAADLYDAVKALGDEDLDRLFTFGIAAAFGQTFCDRPDSDPDSLFNRVAADLGIDMRRRWRPDEPFLRRRSRAQLDRILRDLGRCPSSYRHLTKQELVERLASAFARSAAQADPDDSDRVANDWLPAPMLFPASDDAESGEDLAAVG